MKSENFNKTIERLSSLNNESRNTYKSIGSCVLLFKEFCRRMALWSDTMFLKDHWPLFDITSNIDSSWEIDYNQLSDYLKEKNITIFSPTSNQIIKWFIHWEGNKNKELIKQFNLPDPYEPVITLLERGGDIHKEGGFFEFLLENSF